MARHGRIHKHVDMLFSSVHVNTKVRKWIKNNSFLKRNSIKVVGRLDVSENCFHEIKFKALNFLDCIAYKNTEKDNFW